MMGTFVELGILGLGKRACEAALERGFAAIEKVESLLSSHLPTSDVSRLNQRAALAPIPIDRMTLKATRLALAMSRASHGLFDITVASHLVRRGLLPHPGSAVEPADVASWRDIVIGEGTIAFRRPLWIDFGGIGKGVAVDEAIRAMQLPASASGYVNAGGDIRVAGHRSTVVLLDVRRSSDRDAVAPAQAAIELCSGAIASSDPHPCARAAGTPSSGVLVMPAHCGRPRLPDAFVSVAAPSCAIADALTKVVQAAGEASSSILSRFRARSYYYSQDCWSTLP